jgi:hypothetical protein
MSMGVREADLYRIRLILPLLAGKPDVFLNFVDVR